MQNLAMVVQCAVSVVLGCLTYWGLYPDPNPKVPLLGALVVGFGGGYAVMFLYVWVRYGWKAARGMSMSP